MSDCGLSSDRSVLTSRDVDEPSALGALNPSEVNDGRSSGLVTRVDARGKERWSTRALSQTRKNNVPLIKPSA